MLALWLGTEIHKKCDRDTLQQVIFSIIIEAWLQK